MPVNPARLLALPLGLACSWSLPRSPPGEQGCLLAGAHAKMRRIRGSTSACGTTAVPSWTGAGQRQFETPQSSAIWPSAIRMISIRVGGGSPAWSAGVPCSTVRTATLSPSASMSSTDTRRSGNFSRTAARRYVRLEDLPGSGSARQIRSIWADPPRGQCWRSVPCGQRRRRQTGRRRPADRRQNPVRRTTGWRRRVR
jgi:hypothetical protein